MLLCWLVFSQHAAQFPSDQAKIYYIIGLLQGRALSWAQASSQLRPDLISLEDFLKRFEWVFDQHNLAGCASDRLFTIPLPLPSLRVSVRRSPCNWAALGCPNLSGVDVWLLTRACTVLRGATLSPPVHFGQARQYTQAYWQVPRRPALHPLGLSLWGDGSSG